jgi:hypothetical protein
LEERFKKRGKGAPRHLPMMDMTVIASIEVIKCKVSGTQNIFSYQLSVISYQKQKVKIKTRSKSQPRARLTLILTLTWQVWVHPTSLVDFLFTDKSTIYKICK